MLRLLPHLRRLGTGPCWRRTCGTTRPTDDDSAGVATRLVSSAAALLGATCELAHMQFTLNGAAVGLQAVPGPTLPTATTPTPESFTTLQNVLHLNGRKQ